VELRRTAVGPIRIERAGDLMTPLEALSFLPRFEVDDRTADRIGFGQQVEATEDMPEGEPVALVNADNLLAVARRTAESLKPEVVLESRG
jgi:tRNA U55 pseudouridine synthase TruB